PGTGVVTGYLSTLTADLSGSSDQTTWGDESFGSPSLSGVLLGPVVLLARASRRLMRSESVAGRVGRVDGSRCDPECGRSFGSRTRGLGGILGCLGGALRDRRDLL